MICNTAVFYDIENLVGLYNGKAGSHLHLDEIYSKVLELEHVNGISIQRAYGDWAAQANRTLRSSVLEVGIEPIQVFTTNNYDKVKNAADVCLIIDAVDLIAKRPEIENYVIASGDGIFAFLSRKLHEHGKRVIGVSFEGITSSIFRNSCNHFIYLEKTITNDTQEKKNDTQNFSPETKNAARIPRRFPRTKYSEALQQAGLIVWKDAEDIASCFHAAKQLVDALFVPHTSDMPPLEVSVFTGYLSYYLPKFKLRSHGFKRLNEFMRILTTASPYCLSSEKKNVLIISPRSAAKGTVLEDVKGLTITGENGTVYNSIFDIPKNENFTYQIASVQDDSKSHEKHSKRPYRRRSQTQPQEQIIVDGPIRGWIKNRFEELAEADGLPWSEVKQLTNEEYSKSVFGTRCPIFRKLDKRKSFEEQRLVDGKTKYWKEPFEFKGRSYLIFKEWIAHLHKEKFISWLAGYKK